MKMLQDNCRKVIYNVEMKNISSRTRSSEVLYICTCVCVCVFPKMVMIMWNMTDLTSSQEMQIKDINVT